MSVVLKPITMPRVRQVRYAPRDPIGVEDSRANVTRGINAAAEWAARAEEVFGYEHDLASGSHQVLSIPLGVLVFDGAGARQADSYLFSRDPAFLAGVTCARWNSVNDGLYTLSWPLLPWAGVMVVGGEPGTLVETSSGAGAFVQVRQSSNVAGWGPFSVMIYGVP